MEDRPYIVYMHINKLNSKKYIGTTRIKLHIRSGNNGSNYKECPRFWEAIQKYGWNNFAHVILLRNLTREEASDAEQQIINAFKTQDPAFGYNTTKGGFSLYGKDNLFWNKHHNQKTKDAVAESNKRRIWSEESKEKSRRKLIGGNSPKAIPVRCVETGIVYQSNADAARAIGVQVIKISEVARGIRKSVRGLHFEYLTA